MNIEAIKDYRVTVILVIVAALVLTLVYRLGKQHYRDEVLVECATKESYKAIAGPLQIHMNCNVVHIGV